MKRGNAKKVMALSIAVCMAVTTAVTALPTMAAKGTGTRTDSSGDSDRNVFK